MINVASFTSKNYDGNVNLNMAFYIKLRLGK